MFTVPTSFPLPRGAPPFVSEEQILQSQLGWPLFHETSKFPFSSCSELALIPLRYHHRPTTSSYRALPRGQALSRAFYSHQALILTMLSQRYDFYAHSVKSWSNEETCQGSRVRSQTQAVCPEAMLLTTRLDKQLHLQLPRTHGALEAYPSPRDPSLLPPSITRMA